VVNAANTIKEKGKPHLNRFLLRWISFKLPLTYSPKQSYWKLSLKNVNYYFSLMLHYCNLDRNNLKSGKLKLILSFWDLIYFIGLSLDLVVMWKCPEMGVSPVSSFSFFVFWRSLNIVRHQEEIVVDPLRIKSTGCPKYSFTFKLSDWVWIHFWATLSFFVCWCMKKRPLKMLSMLLSQKTSRVRFSKSFQAKERTRVGIHKTS